MVVIAVFVVVAVCVTSLPATTPTELLKQTFFTISMSPFTVGSGDISVIKLLLLRSYCCVSLFRTWNDGCFFFLTLIRGKELAINCRSFILIVTAVGP